MRFPLGKHFGIIIAHFPNELSTEETNRCLLERLKGISEDEIKGNLIIIELRKTRIKRKEKSVDKNLINDSRAKKTIKTSKYRH